MLIDTQGPSIIANSQVRARTNGQACVQHPKGTHLLTGAPGDAEHALGARVGDIAKLRPGPRALHWDVETYEAVEVQDAALTLQGSMPLVWSWHGQPGPLQIGKGAFADAPKGPELKARATCITQRRREVRSPSRRERAAPAAPSSAVSRMPFERGSRHRVWTKPGAVREKENGVQWVLLKQA